MIDERTARTAGEPILVKKISAWSLVVLSALIGIVAVELSCRFLGLTYSVNVSNYQRAIFFDGPETIFRNESDIFTYAPNKEIRNLTAFYRDKDFNIEYDYRFRTNNLGLVQDEDVVSDKDSILIMGDSYTEGQGAEPWFRLLAPEIVKLNYQAINGGLRGTGFEQWNKLQHSLTAKNIRIRKVVIVFIFDDYQRLIWQPTPATLECLSTPTLCRVERSYYYRLPPTDELPSWMARIRTARQPLLKKSWLAARAETLVPASYHVYGYLKEVYHHLQAEDPAKLAAQQRSREAIAELIQTYGRANVAFLHIPHRDEVGRAPVNLGLRARRAIVAADGQLFDGFTLCGLTRDDYYRNDDHANSRGYAKIAQCVAKVVNQM
jgi:hypothetical protein